MGDKEVDRSLVLSYLRMGPIEIARGISRFGNNAKYFNANYESLREKYLDKYVAIHDQKVIGHEKDFSQLIRILKEKEVDTEEVFIERTYLKGKEPTFILSKAA